MNRKPTLYIFYILRKHLKILQTGSFERKQKSFFFFVLIFSFYVVKNRAVSKHFHAFYTVPKSGFIYLRTYSRYDISKELTHLFNYNGSLLLRNFKDF